MIVWVSGPTGAGKSSLTDAFRRIGYAVVREQLYEKAYRDFIRDPIRHCALLQEQIMHSRYEAWRGLSIVSRRVVFDRSIDEDANVFCRLHHELGFLDDQQYERLKNLARNLQDMMPDPNLIVFMCPRMEVLEERVTELTHPSQIVRTLGRQVSLYVQWLTTRTEDVLRLDNSGCKVQTVRQLFEEGHLC
jgi:deoxyadenosine/deoxycytidine kinase